MTEQSTARLSVHEAISKAWQPLLSISAITISITSLIQSDRANDLAEEQFKVEQARQKTLDRKKAEESRSVVVTEISDDGKELSFSIPTEDVRLREVLIFFPPPMKAGIIGTKAGRPQVLKVADFGKKLEPLVLPPNHGPIVSQEVQAAIPVILASNLTGRGKAYTEYATYMLVIRSKLIGDKPNITIDSFELDVALPENMTLEQQDSLLSKCWKDYQRAIGRHDENKEPHLGFCSP